MDDGGRRRERLEAARLGEGAGKPVQDIAAGVQAADGVVDQGENEVVRYELSSFEVGGRLAPELGSGGDMAAQQLAARQVGHAETISEDDALGALPGAWGAEQHEAGRRQLQACSGLR